MSKMLKIDVDGDIATLTMNRPDKRNAMCEELLDAIDGFFSAPPPDVKVVVLTGTAGHFCSGLDLSELVQRDAEGTMRHSRKWHQILDRIQFGGLPVVSAMLAQSLVVDWKSPPPRMFASLNRPQFFNCLKGVVAFSLVVEHQSGLAAYWVLIG